MATTKGKYYVVWQAPKTTQLLVSEAMYEANATTKNAWRSVSDFFANVHTEQEFLVALKQAAQLFGVEPKTTSMLTVPTCEEALIVSSGRMFYRNFNEYDLKSENFEVGVGSLKDEMDFLDSATFALLYYEGNWCGVRLFSKAIDYRKKDRFVTSVTDIQLKDLPANAHEFITKNSAMFEKLTLTAQEDAKGYTFFGTEDELGSNGVPILEVKPDNRSKFCDKIIAVIEGRRKFVEAKKAEDAMRIKAQEELVGKKANTNG